MESNSVSKKKGAAGSMTVINLSEVNKKYRLFAFPNGRVAFINGAVIKSAAEQHKPILLVCTAWSGGFAYRIEYHELGDGTDKYTENVYDFHDGIYSFSGLEKQYHSIIFTHGETIEMESGKEADFCYNGKFTDTRTNKFEVLKKIHEPAFICYTDSIEYLEEKVWAVRSTVDTEKTLRFLDKEDIDKKVEALIEYEIVDEVIARRFLESR